MFEKNNLKEQDKNINKILIFSAVFVLLFCLGAFEVVEQLGRFLAINY